MDEETTALLRQILARLETGGEGALGAETAQKVRELHALMQALPETRDTGVESAGKLRDLAALSYLFPETRDYARQAADGLKAVEHLFPATHDYAHEGMMKMRELYAMLYLLPETRDYARAAAGKVTDIERVAYLFPETRDHAYSARMISQETDVFLREDVMLLLGQIAARQKPKNLTSIRDAEFRVFSQFGEDGILQYLIDHIQPKDRRFVEFGVQTYDESNTRFLLTHNAWAGLVLDNSQDFIDRIQKRYPYWKYGLAAQLAHITRDNINDLLRNAGYEGRIGLLSIDIDSFDYYIWDAVNVVQPDIVVLEYNRNFPAHLPITIPHSEEMFNRFEAHPSRMYWGASLAAHNHAAKKKGYQFVGTESHQRNAFFVRKDVAAGLPHETPGAAHCIPDSMLTLDTLKGVTIYDVVREEELTL